MSIPYTYNGNCDKDVMCSESKEIKLI
jgi:hypothetical protein